MGNVEDRDEMVKEQEMKKKVDSRSDGSYNTTHVHKRLYRRGRMFINTSLVGATQLACDVGSGCRRATLGMIYSASDGSPARASGVRRCRKKRDVVVYQTGGGIESSADVSYATRLEAVSIIDVDPKNR